MGPQTDAAEGGLEDFGSVPESVLLRAGRPHPMATAAWTPGLHAMDDAAREAVLAASDARLRAAGLLSEDDRPAGALAVLAEMVAATDTVLLFETALGPPSDSAGGAGDVGARGAFLHTGDRVLLLVHDPIDHAYRVQALVPAEAVAALALGLDPFGLALPGGAGVPRDIPVHALAEVVPASSRRSTVRLARVSVAGDDPTESQVTVVGQHDGVVACGALLDGGVRVQQLDRDALVHLSVALLGVSLATEAAAAGVTSGPVA